MSQSDQSATLGRMVIEAALGTKIEVTDSVFKPVGEGDTHLTLDLAQGIFSVRFLRGDRIEDVLATVRAGETITVRPQTAGLATTAGATDEPGDGPFGNLPHDRIAALMRADLKKSEASILVFVRSDESGTTSDIAGTVELRAYDASRRGALKCAAREVNKSQGWSLLRFDIDPGAYELRLSTYERKRVSQTVYGFAERTSIIFMTYSRGSIVAESKGEATITSRRGLDPAQTAMLSFRVVPAHEDLLERLNVARFLVFCLAQKPRVSWWDRLARLVPSCEHDPALALMLAVNLVRIMEANAAGVGGDLQVLDPAPLDSLLGWMREIGPDYQCLRWKDHELRSGWPEILMEQPLRVPPMLDVCWRWAAEVSTRSPRLVEAVGAQVRAEAVNPAFRPWLVVGRQPGEADDALAVFDRDQAQQNLQRVIAMIEVIAAARDGASKALAATARFPVMEADMLAQDIVLANSALSIMGSLKQGDDPIAALARNMGMSASSLGARLDETADALERLNQRADEETPGIPLTSIEGD